MMRAWVLILFAALFLVGAGCEKRDRSNPFDPGNPDTGGVPPFLEARAGNWETFLAWNLDAYEGVRAARIQRRERETEITTLTPGGLDPGVRSYRDASARNGFLYAYRLEVELLSGSRVISEWDEATPGDAVVFVVDSQGGGLARLTPDARDRTFSLGGGSWFLDLAIDTTASSVWSVDFLDGILFEHDFDGHERQRIEVSGARAVDVDSRRGWIWVASFDRGRLERRTRDGALAFSDDTAGAIEDLLVGPEGHLWLCNQEGELRYYNDREIALLIQGLERPVALARLTGGTVYVLERSGLKVSRYDPSGLHLGSSSQVLVDPLDVASDGGGGVWVADPGRGGLVRLDTSLKEFDFVPLEGVLGVTWDDHDQRLWVAGRFGVQIRDAQGEFVSGTGLGPRPVKVEVVHGVASR